MDTKQILLSSAWQCMRCLQWLACVQDMFCLGKAHTVGIVILQTRQSKDINYTSIW